MSIDELKAVCQAAEGELRTLLAVGLYSGLRLHDAVLLRWDAVNLERGMLSVLPHKTARTGRRLAIPLFPTLRAILDESLAAAAGVPLAVVQELCGHASPAIQRHYLHLGEPETRRAVESLPDVLALPAATCATDPAEAADRARLAALAQSMNIAKVRELLAAAE